MARGLTTHGMDRFRRIIVAMFTLSLAMPVGCQWRRGLDFHGAKDTSYEKMATQIEYPAESPCTQNSGDPSMNSPPPVTLDNDAKPEYSDITLQEAIRTALANSDVLRDLGGAVVREPETTRTTADTAIAETNPQFGTEAALSAFDAQFSTSTFWEKNDHLLNNEFFGGGTRNLQQDDAVFQAAITKKSATGAQFTIRHNVDYDSNNAPGNQFPSVWERERRSGNSPADFARGGVGVQSHRRAEQHAGAIQRCAGGADQYRRRAHGLRDWRARLDEQRGERLLGFVLWLSRLRSEGQGTRRGARYVAEDLRTV